MTIAGEYSDEGKYGKSVEGRPQFMQMLRDIEDSKDDRKTYTPSQKSAIILFETGKAD